jgi:homoserine O-acetyltransferase
MTTGRKTSERTGVPGGGAGVGATESRFAGIATPGDPLLLAGGGRLDHAELAYEVYGDPARDDTVLVFHALSGSQHAAGSNPAVPGVGERWTDECVTGWWDDFIGPGRALDTDRMAVVCVNYLGGCYGSTGPASIDPGTGAPYGSSFPQVAFGDIVDSQVRLLRRLGIDHLRGVVGSSIGGLMALDLAVRYPDLVDVVVSIATGITVTPLQAIHNFEQIVAIANDPGFFGGDYYESGPPDGGLALARMVGHKTYVSLDAMEERARAEIVSGDGGAVGPLATTPLESYMAHQGDGFVKRFDANTYLQILRAWQAFELVPRTGSGGPFGECRAQRHLIFSIDSDVSFYPDEQDVLARALAAAEVPHRRITVHSDKGHDAFLLEPDLFTPHLAAALNGGW